MNNKKVCGEVCEIAQEQSASVSFNISENMHGLACLAKKLSKQNHRHIRPTRAFSAESAIYINTSNHDIKHKDEQYTLNN